jgi:N-acetylglutamate synthase-like GNAT family acetyltransferase
LLQLTENETMSASVMQAPITIRPAEDRDLPKIESLLASNDLPLDGVRDAICGFLVAQADDEIVGVIGMEYCGSYGLLRSTAVDAEWRSRGIARALVERIIAEAESRGIRALYLLTTTAERYFPTFGFRATARADVPLEIRATGEFRGACPESATVMCLSMPAA